MLLMLLITFVCLWHLALRVYKLLHLTVYNTVNVLTSVQNNRFVR